MGNWWLCGRVPYVADRERERERGREREMAPDHSRLQPKAGKFERERHALSAIRCEGAHHALHPSHAPGVVMLSTDSRRTLPSPRGGLSQGPALLKKPTRPKWVRRNETRRGEPPHPPVVWAFRLGHFEGSGGSRGLEAGSVRDWASTGRTTTARPIKNAAIKIR